MIVDYTCNCEDKMFWFTSKTGKQMNMSFNVYDILKWSDALDNNGTSLHNWASNSDIGEVWETWEIHLLRTD